MLSIIYLLSSIFINDIQITYVDTVTGASAKIVSTDYPGELHIDVDGDNLDDHFYFISQSYGGRNSFYYLFFELTSKRENSKGTILIDSGITPKDIEIVKNELIILYLDRDEVDKELRIKLSSL